MIYQTRIRPGRELDPEEAKLVMDAIRHCIEVNKTTNGYKQTINLVDLEKRIVIREWTTQEAAEEWINFYSQFSPTHAEIIVEE